VYDLSTLEQPCCIRDGGRPSGAGLQEQAPNHLKLQRSKADVVSVQEKAGYSSSGVAQADERKCTADDVSKASGRRQNRGASFPREQSGRDLLTAQMASGMKAACAWSRLVCGTWEPVALMPREKSKWAVPTRGRVPTQGTGTESPGVVGKVR
jgi:hypothetical protein